jgi:hypothetical protein
LELPNKQLAGVTIHLYFALRVIAMARFLAALTIYKATADVARGGRMFEEQSSVPDAMLPWRATVIAFKQPRRQLVQPVTRLQGDDVVLQVLPYSFARHVPASSLSAIGLGLNYFLAQEFEASAAGLCASYAARCGPSSALRPLFDCLLDVYQL